MSELYSYKLVSIDKVIDGDTVIATIDLGFNLLKTEHFRLLGFDAPETVRPINEVEKLAGENCKQHLKELFVSYPIKKMLVRTYKDTDIYGRFLAEFILSTGDTINKRMIEYIKINHFLKQELR